MDAERSRRVGKGDDAKGPRRGKLVWGVFLWLLFFAQAKKVTRQQAKKGFSEPEEISVNNPSFCLHSHAERGNEKK